MSMKGRCIFILEGAMISTCLIVSLFSPKIGEPSSKVAGDSHVEESKSAQMSEEKSTHEVGNKEQESDEKVVVSQKTENASMVDSKASNEPPVKASSSTIIENLVREDTESQTKTEKAKNVNIDAYEAAKELVVEASSSITNEKFNSEDTKFNTTGKDEASKMELPDKVITLSPFAAEFVPRVALSLQSAVNAPEFAPTPLSQQTDRPVLLRQRSDKPENELMNCVKDVLFGLTQSPGELNSYFYTLVNMLIKWLSSLESLKEVVDLIFEYVRIKFVIRNYLGLNLDFPLASQKRLHPYCKVDISKFL